MDKINWNEPKFGSEELKEISEVLETAYVNEGPKTKELENLIKDYLGVEYVILTTSATAALFLAIKSEAKLRGVDDFEVIVPGITMIATATSVGWAGGKTVLVDVEKERMTLDVEKIEEKITPKTIAIIPVQIMGRASDMEGLKNISEKHNLAIIEDAAGALGSKHEGKFIGTFGKVGCFSLQSNKIITCGQGGIIVTNNEKSYEMIRRLRDFGRLSNKEFLHNEEGYNLKFNDLSAALALGQFKKIDERKDLLVGQFNKYKMELEGLGQVRFPKFNEDEIPLWIEIFAEKRDKLIDFLKSFGISTRPVWPAVHKNKPYQNQGDDSNFPNASFISENVVWLPNGPAISEEQINVVCDKIKKFYSLESENYV